MILKFFSDRHGGFAIYTAVAIPAILAVGGLAVDYSNVQRLKTELQVALDATSVAVAKNYHGKRIDDFARDIFHTNIQDIQAGDVTLHVTYPKPNDAVRKVQINANLRYDTFLMHAVERLFSRPHGPRYMAVASASSVPRDAEVVLVLDNSGSMKKPGFGTNTPRIDILKTSAKELVTTLSASSHPSSGSKSHVKLGIVPFNNWVNVGKDKRNAPWIDGKGISPVHHENLDWENSFPPEGSPECIRGERCVRKNSDGSFTAIGSAWKNLENKYLTRFTILRAAKEKHPAPNIKNGWHGCVESRPAPHTFSFARPSAQDPASLFVPMFHPDEPPLPNADKARHNEWWSDNTTSSLDHNYMDVSRYFTQPHMPVLPVSSSTSMLFPKGPNWECVIEPITPLAAIGNGTGKKEIEKSISDMQPRSGTNVPEGLTWGMHALSPNDPFPGASQFRNVNTRKFIVLLTDGANEYSLNNSGIDAISGYDSFGYYAPTRSAKPNRRLVEAAGVSDKTPANEALNAVFDKLCTEARQEDVTVMAVALDLNNHKADERQQIKLLEECAAVAPGGKRLFWNATSAELPEVFREIASQISNLRITD